MELSPAEKDQYLKKLSTLYTDNGLTSAAIELQTQLGFNFLKGVTSTEEFLFSENLFPIAQQETVERLRA